MEKPRIIASAQTSLIEFDDANKLLIGAALQQLAEQVDTNSKLQDENCFLDDVAHRLQQPQQLTMTSCFSATFSTLTDITQDTLVVKQIQYRPHADSTNIVASAKLNQPEVMQNATASKEIIGNAQSVDDHTDDDDDDNDLFAKVTKGGSSILDDANEQQNSQLLKAILNETKKLDKTNSIALSKKLEQNIIYICPKCGQSCANKNDWLQHTNHRHQLNIFNTFNINMSCNENGQETYECQICKQSTAKRIMFAALKDHHIGHLPFKKYQMCKICKKSYKKTGNIKRHLIRSHMCKPKKKPVELNLDSEMQYVGNNEVVSESMEIIENEKNAVDVTVQNDVYKIIDIIENARSKAKAEKEAENSKSQNSKSDVNADDDNDMIDDEDTDEQDEMNSTDELANYENGIIFTCPECGKICENKTDWLYHTNYKHDLKSIKTYNMKMFINEDGKKNYECQFCNRILTKTTDRLDTLRTHYITHLPFNKYLTCKYCNKAYGAFGIMRRHLVMNHQHKPKKKRGKTVRSKKKSTKQYESDADDYFDDDTVINESRDIIEHVRSEADADENINKDIVDASTDGGVAASTDGGVAVFEDDELDDANSTGDSTNNDVHIIFKCPQCGKICPNKEEWLEHTNDVHDLGLIQTYQMTVYYNEKGKKNYECRICNQKITKTTDRLETLKNHYITHLPYKKYLKCKICDRSYGAFRIIRRHFITSREHNKMLKKPEDEPRSNFDLSSMQDEGNADANDAVNENIDIIEIVKNEGVAIDYVDNAVAIQNTKTVENVKIELDDDVLEERKEITENVSEGDDDDDVDDDDGDDGDDDDDNDGFDESGDDDPTDTFELSDTLSTAKYANYEASVLIRCPQCGMICANRKDWNQHTLVAHQYNSIETFNMNLFENSNGVKCAECRVCKKTYIKITDRLETLRNHYISHLKLQKFLTCKICNKGYKGFYEMKRHIAGGHQGANYNIKALMKYVTILCQVCGIKLKDRPHMYRHLQQAHKFKQAAMKHATLIVGDMCTCDVCNIRVRLRSLERHMLVHQPHKPYVCNLCSNYTNTDQDRALRHVYRVHLHPNKYL